MDDIFVKGARLSRVEKRDYIARYNDVHDRLQMMRDTRDLSCMMDLIFDNIRTNFDNPEKMIEKMRESIEKNQIIYDDASTSEKNLAIVESGIVQSAFYSYNDMKFLRSIVWLRNIRESRAKIKKIAHEDRDMEREINDGPVKNNVEVS